MLGRVSNLGITESTAGQVKATPIARLLSSGGLVVSRGVSIVAQFLVQIMVAATAGASGLGVLQLLTAWVCIGGEVLALGLPLVAMRQISVASANGEKEVVLQLLRRARKMIIRAWLLFALLAMGPLLWLSMTQNSSLWMDYGSICIGALLLAPVFALSRLYAESLKGLGLPLAAVTLENLISPVALLLVSGFCWFRGDSVTSATLLLTAALGFLFTLLAMQQGISRHLQTYTCLGEARATKSPKISLDELLHLWGGSVLSILFLQMPFLLLPLFTDVAEIGVFALAHKLINVITVLLVLLAALFGPAFARCAERGDRGEMQKLLRRTQALSVGLYLPLSLLVIAASDAFSKSLADQGFMGLTLYLLILASGQLVNAVTGLAGVMLNMVGAARSEFYILLGSSVVGLSSALCFGVLYGPLGIACAWSASVALKNLGSYFVARNYLLKMGSE